MKLSITYKSVDALIPYVRNSRTHSEAQIAQIAASIREFGFTNAILLDEDNGIIAGHGRLLAARKLGMKEVPTVELSHLTPAQRRAYVIADNQLALNAGWDMDLLKLEVADLSEVGFDLDLLGFDETTLEGLLAPPPTEGEGDPDDVPETPLNPVTRPGDVWLLGRHRLACGDCTDALVVASALNGVRPHLMVTDPPYGVDYDPNWRTTAKNGDGSLLSTGKGRAKGKVENDDKADWYDAWALFPGEVAYVWHGEKQLVAVADQLQRAGFELRNLIVWAKSALVVGRGNYHSQHETCWYVVRKGGKGHWSGSRKETTVWNIEKLRKSETGHSTQKPVECMSRPIENNSSPGQAVYEPFSGSGTTIIAAEMTGRTCLAIEINPAFCDVAVKRWQDFTGETATREADGVTFDEATDAKR